MTTYTTGRKSYWPHILKQWSIAAGIFFIIIFLAHYFITIKEGTWWIGAGLMLFWFSNLANRRRIYKIVIDETANTITQYYRNPFAGEGEKVHVLDDKVQLYINNKPVSAAGEKMIWSLQLYKSRRSILDLSTKEDGFSPATLQAIRLELERLLVPVTG